MLADDVVQRRAFFNKAVAHRVDKDGKFTPCVFFEWFYKCASIVNKYMQVQWNDGYANPLG